GEECATVSALRASAGCRGVPVVVFSVLRPDGLPPPDDRLREGAEFWLEQSLARLVRSTARPATVLVVEDDPDLAQVLAARFERHEVRVVRAASGREAIELSEKLR